MDTFIGYCRCAAAILLTCALMAPVPATSQEARLREDFRPTPRGSFPDPEPLTAGYRFGWATVDAAEAEIRLRGSRQELRVDGAVSTRGAVRLLWKLDATLQSVLRRRDLRARHVRQVEKYRSETVVTELRAGENEVIKRRQEKPQDASPKEKRYRLVQPYDLSGAVMALRSQRLRKGDVYEFIVFPASSPYFARVTVGDREEIKVKAGRFRAVRVDLELRKVDEKGRLVSHRKFKSASAWFSDDRERLLLRVASEVFVGSVWVELQSVSRPAGGLTTQRTR